MKATSRRPSRPTSKACRRFPLVFITVGLFVGVWHVFFLHSSLFETTTSDEHEVVQPIHHRHRVLPRLENCSAVYPVDDDGATTTNTEKRPCALLFFGLAKNFRSLVYPSVRDNILRANPSCDVFAHTYNISFLKSHRNQEHGNAVNASEIYLLTQHVKMETIDEFEKQHNMTHLLQDRFRVDGKHGWEPQSYVNMLRQWHSIEQVWKLMQQYEHAQHIEYQRVGLFRSDVFYFVPIDISHGGDAVIPAFGKMTNDRMFYGSNQNAYIWANIRFPSVDCYVPPLPSHGLHSEHFMSTLVLPNIPNWTRRYDICFMRVRGHGQIKKRDCMFNYTGPRPWERRRKREKNENG